MVTISRARRATSAGDATRHHFRHRPQVVPAFLDALRRAAPDHDLFERQHFGVHPGLQACLYAGPQDAQDGVVPPEFAGRHGGDGGRADVGQVPGIGQERHRIAGFGGGEQHHAVAGGEAAPQVAGEGARDLHGEMEAALPVAGLDMDLGERCRDVQMHRHRGIAFAARLGDERIAHAVDHLAIDQDVADFVETEDAHGNAANPTTRI